MSFYVILCYFQKFNIFLNDCSATLRESELQDSRVLCEFGFKTSTLVWVREKCSFCLNFDKDVVCQVTVTFYISLSLTLSAEDLE